MGKHLDFWKFYEQHFIFPLAYIRSDEVATIIAQVGDGITIAFGIVAKIVEVGSSMEVFFFHVVVVIVEVGNNFDNDFVTQASFGQTTIVAQANRNILVFFILLGVGVFFFLACACILCLVFDGLTHVVSGLG